MSNRSMNIILEGLNESVKDKPTKDIKISDVKKGDYLKMSDYESGMTSIVKIVDIEDYKWPNGKLGKKLYFDKTFAGRKYKLFVNTNIVKKVV